MPIANCIITTGCYEQPRGSVSLIDIWAKESGVPSKDMTINLVKCHEQFGNTYDIMATLYLPSIWSKSEVSSIQLGLAKALSVYFEITSDRVHVITNIVCSGMVVESGEEVNW